jgi:hypothetical protein
LGSSGGKRRIWKSLSSENEKDKTINGHKENAKAKVSHM